MRIDLSHGLALSLAFVAATSSPAHSQVRSPRDHPPDFWANLQIAPEQPSRLQVVGHEPDDAISEALARIAGAPPTISEYGGDWTQWIVELPPPMRRGWVLRQEIDLGPLLGVLHERGEPSLSLLVQHPRVGFVALSGAAGMPVQAGAFSATLPTRPSSPRFSVELGWRASDLTRALLLILVALLAPIVAGLVIRRRPIVRDRLPEAWFPRVQSIQLVIIGGWALWMAVLEATRVADFTDFAFPRPGWYSAVLAPMWILGFLPAALALTAIARRLTRRLRGFDPLPRGAAGRLQSVRAMGSFLLLIVALCAFAAGHVRGGVFALLTAMAAAILLPGARGPFGTTPQSLSSGALRDRLFDLARRAGVRLRDLSVVPMRRQRMANAFAVHGGTVLVADELLDRMSRREVDAILAHEVTHLEHHHPIKMLLAASAVWGLVTIAATTLRIPLALPGALVASWVTYLFVARRFELAADAGAAALTGDAEAVISGLGHLARLNDVPLSWGRGWRWCVTHPTTEARARAIGRRAGLASERVSELLTVGLPASERYSNRERPGEHERVFSTAWKTATVGRLGLAVLGAAVIAPAAAIALVRALDVSLGPLLAIAAGAALSLGATLFVHDLFAARVVSRLEPALRRRLAANEEDGQAQTFVALSPGDRARVYEGFLDWDIGLLTIERDRIRYRGEQTAFDVSRASVRSIDLGAVAPSWIRAPRVIVRWMGSSGEEAVALRPADCRRVSAIGPASTELASRLRAWRDQSGPAPALDASHSFGPVTARTPAEVASLRDLPVLLLWIGTLSAACGFVLGFDFWAGVEVFAAALLGVLALRWPALSSRERSMTKSDAPERERRAA